MKALLALGVDITYFYQLGLIILFYLILKNVLFKKLLFVIQTREDQTTKRTDSASEKLVEVTRMKAEYEQNLVNANNKAQNLLVEKKHEVVKRESTKLKTAEAKISEELEFKRVELKSQLTSLRSKAFESSSSLSSDLVNKIIQ